MLIIEIHATSHIGRVCKSNEDNYLLLHISDKQMWTSSQAPDDFTITSKKFEVDENGTVLAISDGEGEIASQMAVEIVSKRLLNEDLDITRSPYYTSSLVEKFYDATVYANQVIHNQGRMDPQFNGMFTTFTGVGVTPEAVDYIHVGDSRVYLIRNAKIYQVTRDQSLIQKLIDSGRISPEEAETHALKNVILQALGAQNEVYPVPARLIPQRNDILLLCSDGLSNKLHAEDLLRIVLDNFGRFDDACTQLIKEANENGGEDNITVVLARLSGSDLMEPTEDPVVIHPLQFGDIQELPVIEPKQSNMEPDLVFQSSAVSDKGLNENRPQNEDSYLEMPEHGLFSVADGVNGAQAGDVASQMAMEILGEAFSDLPEGGDVEELMEVAISRANGAIYQMSHDLPQLSTMATTIVSLHITKNIATIGHVGNSRLYRLDPRGNLYRETQDHSVVEEEIRAGRMTREQAEHHPSKNLITRALGAGSSVEIDIKTIMFEPHTTFLLCSGGITRHIPDTELRDLLALPAPPVKICQQMKEICYSRGAEDNFTAVIVKIK